MSQPAQQQQTRSYETAVKDLNSCQTNASVLNAIKASGGSLNKRSLPEMVEYFRRIGYPDMAAFNQLNVIHVTGTKGKGSTCAFVESILRRYAASATTTTNATTATESKTPKIRTGLFTSPHLVHARERIRIDGKPLSSELFTKYFYECWDALMERAGDPAPVFEKRPLELSGLSPPATVTAAANDEGISSPTIPPTPTYFRFLTMLAYHVFMREGVNVAIFEVGVGGEYDSTNVIQRPVVCAVSSLGLDHQNVLGNTIPEIAWNKGGIAKPGATLFTPATQAAEGVPVLQQRAAERQTELKFASSLAFENVKLGIAGDHQRQNASLAVAVCREWISKIAPTLNLSTADDVVESAIHDGLESAKWPGRSQRLVDPQNASIEWFIDGAHTFDSMLACSKWFASVVGSEPASGDNSNTVNVLLFNAAYGRNSATLLDALAKETIKNKVGFTHAVFCPNITSNEDQKSYNHDPDTALAAQHEFAGQWTQLNADTGKSCEMIVKPTIEDAVAVIRDLQSGKHLRVLVTGSLHLSGGVIATLGVDPFADN
ncbi:FolC bifunctional protein [Ramicandelaber brevisporus]|nr:FolC bifunctional protein [Ramicandelaber brevisporus]